MQKNKNALICNIYDKLSIKNVGQQKYKMHIAARCHRWRAMNF